MAGFKYLQESFLSSLIFAPCYSPFFSTKDPGPGHAGHGSLLSDLSWNI